MSASYATTDGKNYSMKDFVATYGNDLSALDFVYVPKTGSTVCSDYFCNKKKDVKIDDKNRYTCSYHYNAELSKICTLCAREGRKIRAKCMVNDVYLCIGHYDLCVDHHSLIDHPSSLDETKIGNLQIKVLDTIKPKVKKQKHVRCSRCSKHGVNVGENNVLFCHSHAPEHACNWYLCAKVNELTEAHRGIWCPIHLPKILNIRSDIQPHHNTESERIARLKEIQARKHKDPGHIYYYLQMMSEHIAKNST